MMTAYDKQQAPSQSSHVRGWQTIETADRDGRDILLTDPHWNGDVVVGSFCFGAWRDRPDPYSLPIYPTLWMAIPPVSSQVEYHITDLTLSRACSAYVTAQEYGVSNREAMRFVLETLDNQDANLVDLWHERRSA